MDDELPVECPCTVDLNESGIIPTVHATVHATVPRRHGRVRGYAHPYGRDTARTERPG